MDEQPEKRALARDYLVKHWRLLGLAAAGTVVFGFLAAWAYADFLRFQAQGMSQLQATGVSGDIWIDRRSQQETAEFAYGAMLFAGFALVASISGVVMVGYTLWQNRRMIEATREIGQNEMRAYVYPAAVSFKWVSPTEDASIVIVLKNSGRTPALRAVLRTSITRAGMPVSSLPTKTLHETTLPFIADETARVPKKLAGADFRGMVMAGLAADAAWPTVTHFEVGGTVAYQDVFNDTYETSFLVEGQISDKPGEVQLRFVPAAWRSFVRKKQTTPGA